MMTSKNGWPSSNGYLLVFVLQRSELDHGSQSIPAVLPGNVADFSLSSSRSSASSLSSSSDSGRTNGHLAPMPVLAPALRFLASQNMLTGGYVEPALAATTKFFIKSSSSPSAAAAKSVNGGGESVGVAAVAPPPPSLPSSCNGKTTATRGPIRRRPFEKSSIPISIGEIR